MPSRKTTQPLRAVGKRTGTRRKQTKNFFPATFIPLGDTGDLVVVHGENLFRMKLTKPLNVLVHESDASYVDI